MGNKELYCIECGTRIYSGEYCVDCKKFLGMHKPAKQTKMKKKKSFKKNDSNNYKPLNEREVNRLWEEK